MDISNKLNLEEKEIANFLGKVLEKNQSDVKKINNLKIIHFSIVQELERLEKIKNRADKTASFRVTIILLILLSILIVQTGGFYHMIYNIDYLGWDLVEPATFLFSSALFLLGVFSYAKLHKNAISGEKLFCDAKLSVGFKVSDIFNRQGFYFKVDQAAVDQYSEFKWLTRRYYLTLSYKFGKLEISNKKKATGSGGGEDI